MLLTVYYICDFQRLKLLLPFGAMKIVRSGKVIGDHLLHDLWNGFINRLATIFSQVLDL